jgi:E3 ubiquitin-protein ligase SHPRH
MYYCSDKQVLNRMAVEDIADNDVVLTTFQMLHSLSQKQGGSKKGQMKKHLAQIHFHRMVIDECQFVKNDTNVLAKAAAEVSVTSVWMLSGTPLTTKLEDLQGELTLLRVWPFVLSKGKETGWSNWFWEQNVKQPWEQKERDSLRVVHQLVKSVALRHSKMQRYSHGGKPLVDLPR